MAGVNAQPPRKPLAAADQRSSLHIPVFLGDVPGGGQHGVMATGHRLEAAERRFLRREENPLSDVAMAHAQRFQRPGRLDDVQPFVGASAADRTAFEPLERRG